MTRSQIDATLATDRENLADLRARAAAFGPRFAKEYAPRIAKLEQHIALWTEMRATAVA